MSLSNHGRNGRDILTVQASTVASESAFSFSGRVLNERRSRLSPQSLEVCISLHHIWPVATAKVKNVAKNVAIGKK